MDYNFGITHPFRRHRYFLQNLLLMQAILLTRFTMGNSSPFVGDTAPTVDRHRTTAFAGRHTAGCNADPEVCELNPAHHLLSLPVL